MTKPRPLRASILYAFLIIAMGICLCMGFAGWLAGEKIGSYLMLRQTEPIMGTLIEAERQAMIAKDNDEAMWDSAELAGALGWDFMVGKELPPALAKLPPGFNISTNTNSFTLVAEKNGIKYALCGTLGQFTALRHKLVFLLCACGFLCLLLAFAGAMLLHKHLARPLKQLAAEVRRPDIQNGDWQFLPEHLLGRQDEVGLLAREIEGNRKNLREYLLREIYFTGDASHELRTPLTIMKGGLEILHDKIDRLDPAHREALLPPLLRLERTTDKMRALINVLLALARNQRNAPRTKVSIAALLLEIIRNNLQMIPCATVPRSHSHCYMLPTKAAQKLYMDIFARPVAYGDRELMAIVIGNLLENALRYSENGLVSVALTENMIRVENEGASAAMNLQSTARRDPGSVGGYGFGLSLASRACERLQWQLCQGSENGKTFFVVRLESINDSCPERSAS